MNARLSAALAALGLSASGAVAFDSVVVINEVSYHPAAGGTEFIELRNLHGVDVHIGGWRLSSAVDFTFPDDTILPGGGYLVVAANPALLPGALGPWSGSLDNAGETLRLRNLNGRIMDELAYDDGKDWPVAADGSGVTLSRRAAGAAAGPDAWTVSDAVGGTPGGQNFFEPGTPAVITRVVAVGDEWKYDDSGAAAPVGWNTAAHDDSAWKSGASLLAGGGAALGGGNKKPSDFPGGLMAYWAFDETSGTVAANAVPGSPEGTMANGATFVTDPVRGRVASFDGANDRMEVIDPATSLPSLTFMPTMTSSNDFTWAAWVFQPTSPVPTAADQFGSVILGNRSNATGADTSPREFIKLMPTAMQYHRNAVTENLDYPDLVANTWTHMCVVKRGLTLDYYRNGAFVLSKAITGGLSTPLTFFVAGDRRVSTAEHFAGRVDDVGLWTRALTAEEIANFGPSGASPAVMPTPAVQTTTVATGPEPRLFRKSFTWSGNPATATLHLWPVADDGAVIYLNGTEIWRSNVPVTSEVENAGFTGTAIDLPATALLNGTNLLAAEVHQASGGNTDLLFGAELRISALPGPPPAPAPSLVLSEVAGAADAAFFIELANTAATAASTEGWTLVTSTGQTVALPAVSVPAGGWTSFDAATLGFGPADGVKLFLFAPGGTSLRDARVVTNRLRGLVDGGRWGHPTSPTPGAANVAVVSTDIVINEIFYHSIDPASPEQWLELYNRGVGPVDVSGWKFSDGVDFDFPAGTVLPAGGFAVVAWDPVAFATKHPGVTALGPWSGSLAGGGEVVRLRDANDNVVDEVRYHDGGRWSEWADGGGSSLELRDPRADNSQGEAWDASDESLATPWQTFSHTGTGAHATTSSLTYFNEFLMGLLDAGEVLVDDISVKEVNQGNRELIQNGTFDSGTAATWRNIGTHGFSTVVDDPFAPGNKVLKLVATGATEHMHNHCETTLKSGSTYVALSTASTYTVSFRAKWLRGSNRLHTRLYFNRLPRQSLLTVPTTGGTPGAPNSRLVANAGPTFAALGVSPVVPPAGTAATVSVTVADPDSIASVELLTSVNGQNFATTAMTGTGGGVYTASTGTRASGTLMHFYVRATDAQGAVSFFPAAGPAARAMIPWDDGRSQFVLPSGCRPHNIRIVMPAADANDMYQRENVHSNHYRPCTVIVNDQTAHYTAGTRLKSSEHGRFQDNRVGFNLKFPADDLFFGAHATVSVDRSGNKDTTGIDGTGISSQREILIKTVMNHAGGIHAVEDDLIRVITPVAAGSPTPAFTGATLTGEAILSKSRFDDEFLDGQWSDGGKGPFFKQEYIYPLTQTINPTTRAVSEIPASGALSAVAEQPKISQTGGSPGPSGINVQAYAPAAGVDPKENYRWHWLIRNARAADDFSGLISAVTAVGQAQGSAAFNTQTQAALEVDTWLRAAVVPQLFGVTDNYLGSGSTHNFILYFPPGGKGVAIPWDLDFLAQSSTTAGITSGGQIGKFIANPVHKRRYYGHVLDVLNRSFNDAFLTRWAAHYTCFGGDDMTTSLAFLRARATYVRNLVTGAGGQTAPVPQIAFSLTSGGPLSVTTPFATVTGRGWIDVEEIRLLGSDDALPVTWTTQDAWTLQLPLRPLAGAQVYTLVAVRKDGTEVGRSDVTVTTTSPFFPAGPGQLVLSEINYNPPGSGDLTEFVELLNITGATLDLGGCHFDDEGGEGIAYTFPQNTQLAAGGRIVVARDMAAFAAAYPGVTGVVGPFVGALDNSGETLVLYAASGAEILRTTYQDAPASTDGGGFSLVRVLGVTPDPTYRAWRSSTTPGGNPGATDALAFTGDPLADADGDGIPWLIEWAFGLSDSVFTPLEDVLTLHGTGVPTFPAPLPNADAVIIDLEQSSSLETWTAPSAAPPSPGRALFRLRGTMR